jgi:hypothetical protein
MADNPYMTAGEAILWIATRDADYAAEFADATGIGLDVALNARPHYGHAPKLRSEASARKALGNKCRDGRIVALGLRGGMRKVTGESAEQIALHAWAYLNIRELDERMVAEPSNGGEYWHDLRFRRIDVVRAFPELDAVPPAPVGKAEPAAPLATKSGGMGWPEVKAEFRSWVAGLTHRPTREEVGVFISERRPNQGGLREKARELLASLGPGTRGRRRRA